MEGVWERQIELVHVILLTLLKQQGTRLSKRSLITLLKEVESVVSLRPLTVETLSNIESGAPSNPVNLLIMKSNVFLLSSGNFKQTDLYIVDIGGEFNILPRSFDIENTVKIRAGDKKFTENGSKCFICTIISYCLKMMWFNP